MKFDHLRYGMLPYIYSLAGGVTQDGGTMMRPLVMDFQNDMMARDITDEYMFGPAFLVAPVTTYQARSRSVYLPPTSGDWYDFWTGTRTAGGQTIDAPAPYDSLPLFIRAGSIIPFGPELQYTGEKPADPITLYVYAGANGAFTLYEDDGLTYGYEKGAFARIPINWDNASRNANHRQTRGPIPRHAGQTHIQSRAGGQRQAGRFFIHPQGGSNRHLSRRRCEGEVQMTA